MKALEGAAWLKAPETQALMAALQAGGGEARFVGGCVRDTLLDPTLDRIDLDVATQERPEAVMTLLRAIGARVVPTGLKHGTVTAILGGRGYEITTLREDVACDGRHAEVRFGKDFGIDAARRDFTINTLACDAQGCLHDEIGGYDDLIAGVVRFVGEPRRRIAEDYLRILRFFRFHARFAKNGFDAAALDACVALQDGLDRLSAERKRQELLRLLVLPDPMRVLPTMRTTGILGRILGVPADTDRLGRLLPHEPSGDAVLRLAALARGPNAPARDLGERLRLSGQETARLEALLREPPLPDSDAPPEAHRRAAARLGVERYRDLARLRAATDAASPAIALRALEGFTLPDFPLSGDDLLARGLSGPELGRGLRELREVWIGADFRPSKESLLRRLGHLDAGDADA